MPKGVEHYLVSTSLVLQVVHVESLMPKGVEHSTYAIKAITELLDVESLMPKGVEHGTGFNICFNLIGMLNL